MSILKAAISGTPRRNNHAHVVNELGRAIVSGTYKTGENLPKDAELENRFNVSRTVLREAMKTLGAKGLIVARARVGTRVTDQSDWNFFDKDVLTWHMDAGFDQNFFAHLTDIRLSLEPFAAKLAAACILPKDARQLMQLCDDMEQAADNEAFALADLQFHQILLRASGNPFMFSIGNIIEAALANAFKLSGPTASPAAQAKTVDLHRQIATAVTQGDGEAAQAAMQNAIAIGRDRVLNSVTP